MTPLGTATGRTAPQVPVALWQLRLLGGFSLDDGQQPLTRLSSRAAVQLLARLALAPGRQHAREELIELLWPGVEPDAGRNRLRQTLFSLKAVLEPPGGSRVLLADRRAVWLVPHTVWCDVPAFEQAVRARCHEEALALYRGELLPGLYDDWVHDERQRLQALADRLPEPAPGRPPPAAEAASGAPAGAAGQATAPMAQPWATRTTPAALRLPHYLTRLVGADLSGARLRELVRQQRLVTVLGAGGCGKTRLAVEVARQLSDPELPGDPAAFDRVMFVSLVGCLSGTQLLDGLLMSLQIGGTGDPFEKLQAALDSQRLLLILDNAEQLDDGGVATLVALAEQLPAVHWLVTSRRPLGVDGEQRFMLEPLELPAAGAPLAELGLSAAIALFVDRARAHRPDFHLTAGNRDSVIELVTWLGGLPLAIELAASRSRSVTPAQMLALLQGRPAATAGDVGSGLTWLARRGPRGGRDARQTSMRAVMDWSWDLLHPTRHALLVALSAFPGGASREAARFVLMHLDPDGPALPSAEVQCWLDDLIDHSLVQLRSRPSTGAAPEPAARHTMVPPLREYVASRLPAPERLRLQAGLLAWAQAWAHQLPATPPLAEVRDELPNLLAALATAREAGAGSQALALALSLQPAWSEIALPGSALDLLCQVLELPGLPAELAAPGHALVAWSAHEAGLREMATRHADRAQVLLADLQENALKAQVLHRVARMRWRIHRDSAGARQWLALALPLAQQQGLHGVHGALLSLEAHLAAAVDHDAARASELSRQALALCRLTGNAHLVNAHRFNAAVNLILGGTPSQALPELALLAAEGRALNDWDLAAGALDASGTALLALRRWAESAHAHRESLAMAWQAMDALAIIYALWNIAPALARLRRPRLAALAMGHAAQAWPRRFGEFDASDLRDLRRLRRFVRVLMPAAEAEAAWQAGRTQGLAEVVRAVLDQG